MTTVIGGNPEARIALVAATVDEARRVMIEGDSGLLKVARAGERPVFRANLGEVTFASGAIGYVFSAAAGEKLRGSQHHAAWCDELGKWRDGARAWDNLLLGSTASEDTLLTVDTTEPVANAYGSGLLRWVIGGNSGLESAIGASDGATLTLRAPPRFESVGALVELIEGCDKSIVPCAGRFANAANFRGEPYLPGIDLLTRYPGA